MMNARFLSAGNYMLDAFAISLLLVFLRNEADLPLAFIWLVLSFTAAILSFIFFAKRPYQVGVIIALSAAVIPIAVLLGASGWMAVFMGLLTLYRLHARFSIYDDGTNADGKFLLVFVLLFSASLVVDLFSPLANSSTTIFAIVAGALVFYVLFRMAYRYLEARTQGAKPVQAVGTVLAVLGLSGGSSLLVWLLGDEVRQGAAMALAGILRVILWPFAGLMEKLTDYLSGLSTESEMKATLEKLGPEESEEQAQEMIASGSFDFPSEIFLAVGGAAAIIALIFWLKKVTVEKGSEKPENEVTVERFATIPETVETESKSQVVYGEVDLQAVREAFRTFAKEAAAAGKGREEFETVKEWANRMAWPVSEEFLETYDLVRYGEGAISEKDACPFINEIQKLKENFFEKNV
ncbi:hypothetical protein BN1080_01238 [Planococcus massiliensis]|uniref:DUF4129 domain-containing protein n=1 Tax=Planococcus massiliensis TaxID=1499687 RepID=A0A098EK78_9BACL|nr:hypothetical protein [Planococcus massiliensis]CEG22312.1 hypothetical protein BN1080_01238 [Planococcus massiliensis]